MSVPIKYGQFLKPWNQIGYCHLYCSLIFALYTWLLNAGVRGAGWSCSSSVMSNLSCLSVSTGYWFQELPPTPPTTKIYRCSSLHIKWSRSVLVVCPLYPWTPSLRWKIVQVFIGKKIHIISGPMQCKTMFVQGSTVLAFYHKYEKFSFSKITSKGV